MRSDIFDPTPDLPQNRATLRDGVRNKGAEQHSSEKVVLLGTAVDGPVLEPITIENLDDATDIFGRYHGQNGLPNGATLTRYATRLLDDKVNNPDNVALMRISGKEATGEIELNPESIRKFVEEDIFLGEVKGNDEYVINIAVPDGEHEVNGITFDEARLENVSIQGDGTPISSSEYDVKNNIGDIILKEDATNPGASLYIEYEIHHIQRNEVLGEEHAYADTANSEEYQLENDNIVPKSEIVFITPDDLDGDGQAWTELAEEDYVVDWDAGVLNLTQEIYSEPNVRIDYTYEEIEAESNTLTHEINGGTQYLYLNHRADPRKDIEVTANGSPLEPGIDYEVNYNSLSVTIIELNEGSPRVIEGERIRVNYQWLKIETNTPSIQVESIYGGEIYNEVKIEAMDKLMEKNDRTKVEADISGDYENMLPDPNEDTVFYFPNEERGIVAESVSIYLIDSDTGSETVLTYEEDFTVNEAGGYITVPQTVADSVYIDDNYLVTKSYVYTEIEERLYTTVKGSFNKDTMSYEGIELNKLTREKIELENEYIVPDSLNLRLVENGNTETALEEGTDYEVNYSDGLIYITSDEVYPLDSTKKVIADEYKYYNVTGKELKIIKPDAKAQETPKTIVFDLTEDYTNVANLIQAINNHRDNNVIQVSADNDTMRASTMNIITPDRKTDINNNTIVNHFDMSGGENQVDLSKEEIYEKLGGKLNENGEKIELGAYDILKDYQQARYIVPLDVYADDELDIAGDFAQQLANFCASTFYANNEVFGYIGMSPVREPSQVNVIERVREAERMSTDFFLQDKYGEYLRDNRDNLVDAGRCISIVNIDLMLNDPRLAGTTIENAAPMVAGIDSTLTRVNSISNETFGVGILSYQLSPRQQQRLLRNKIMCGRNVYGDARVVEGRTCAVEESGWELTQTIKIAYNTMNDLRAIYDKYSGDGNSLPKRNSLDAEIEQSLKENPGLVDFDHELIMSPKDRRIGRLIVRLDIVPVAEFRKIHTVISINEEL